MKKLPLATATKDARAPSNHATDTPNLVTILASNDPQTQLMCMVLTMRAIEQGAKAHLLLCGPAGDLALKDAPVLATEGQKPSGMSPQGLMHSIMNTGTKVEVCAIYLPNKGLSPDALLDGISAADPSAMAAQLIAPNTRIVSL